LWRRPHRPTAIFAAADMLAIGLIRGARAEGVIVPRDLSVVGFADMLHVDLFDPPLTTVRQSTEQFGRRGVQLLVSQLRREAVSRTIERVSIELMVRGSVAKPRRRSPLQWSWRESVFAASDESRKARLPPKRPSVAQSGS
jgi:LacI family transcriptional regulator